MIKTTMKIDGMMCGMCEAHICDAIRKAVPEAKKVTASKSKKQASFLTDKAVANDFLQAAINATAALVAGYAQVQKIASVDTSGNAQASGGGATALAIPNIEGLSSPIDYTRQVTTETEREQMNQDNRVYILESDIQQSNNRVRVREEETTF